jgi:CRP-like cAMP-binding protein
MQPLTKTYKKATHLFHEKDHSRELYIVQSGVVRVYRRINGREIDLARISKGAVLGEMALIDGKPRSASAVAVEDTTVVMIDAETFEKRIIRDVPSWFISMIRCTSEKIRNANSRLEALQDNSHCLHAALALQYYFLRSADSRDPAAPAAPAAEGLDVSQTVSRLIGLLSVSTQCAMQVLDMLQKNNITDLREGRILLRDQAKLDGLCEYLRFHFRKSFDKTGKPSAGASALLRALSETVAAGGVDLSGGDVAAACLKSNAAEGALEAVDELRDLGIMSYIKQAPAKGGESPLSGYQFSVDPESFRKYLLYCTYKDMVPAL